MSLYLLKNCFLQQVQFYEVSEEELAEQRKQFQTGQIQIEIEETTFSMRYSTFLHA